MAHVAIASILILWLAALSQGLIQRDDVHSVAHTFDYVQTPQPPHRHFARRHLEDIPPLAVSFFGQTLTLMLHVNHRFFEHSLPALTAQVDTGRFLAGHVHGLRHRSWVRLYMYEKGVDGVMAIITAGQTEMYRLETIIEKDGTISDDIIIFRERDMQVSHHLPGSTCGHAPSSVAAPAKSVFNSTSSARGKMHTSLDPFSIVKSLHLQGSSSSFSLLRKRADDDGKPTTGADAGGAKNGTKNTNPVAMIGLLYDDALKKGGEAKSVVTWALQRLAVVSGDYESNFGVTLLPFHVANVGTVSGDAGSMLSTIASLVSGNKLGYSANDVALSHLLTTHEPSSGLLGQAQVGTVCGGASAHGFTIMVGSDVGLEETMAHEMGHNFGANHDEGQCFQANYVMAAINSNLELPLSKRQWSSCSHTVIQKTASTVKCFKAPGTVNVDRGLNGTDSEQVQSDPANWPSGGSGGGEVSGGSGGGEVSGGGGGISGGGGGSGGGMVGSGEVSNNSPWSASDPSDPLSTTLPTSTTAHNSTELSTSTAVDNSTTISATTPLLTSTISHDSTLSEKSSSTSTAASADPSDVPSKESSQDKSLKVADDEQNMVSHSKKGKKKKDDDSLSKPSETSEENEKEKDTLESDKDKQSTDKSEVKSENVSSDEVVPKAKTLTPTKTKAVIKISNDAVADKISIDSTASTDKRSDEQSNLWGSINESKDKSVGSVTPTSKDTSIKETTPTQNAAKVDKKSSDDVTTDTGDDKQTNLWDSTNDTKDKSTDAKSPNSKGTTVEVGASADDSTITDKKTSEGPTSAAKHDDVPNIWGTAKENPTTDDRDKSNDVTAVKSKDDLTSGGTLTANVSGDKKKDNNGLFSQDGKSNAEKENATGEAHPMFTTTTTTASSAPTDLPPSFTGSDFAPTTNFRTTTTTSGDTQTLQPSGHSGITTSTSDVPSPLDNKPAIEIAAPVSVPAAITPPSDGNTAVPVPAKVVSPPPTPAAPVAVPPVPASGSTTVKA